MKTIKENSRRTFLKAAAVTGAAAIIPGQLYGKNQPDVDAEYETFNKNPLKQGIMTYNIAKKWDIETIIKNLTETGFQSVELRTTHAHGIEVNMSKKERAEVKKRFEDSPLEAISLASAFKYHYPDQAELRKNIEGTKEYTLLARDVGAIGFRVFPNTLPKGVDPEKTMEQIGKSLAEVGEFAYNHGVEIRVCAHGDGTRNIPVIKKIIDYSNSPHVYVNWNCSSTDLEGEGLEYNFNLVKDRIRSLHTHELWNPDYPYRKLFKLLADNNFQGYCNAEISDSEDPIRVLHYYRGIFLALQNAL